MVKNTKQISKKQVVTLSQMKDIVLKEYIIHNKRWKDVKEEIHTKYESATPNFMKKVHGFFKNKRRRELLDLLNSGKTLKKIQSKYSKRGRTLRYISHKYNTRSQSTHIEHTLKCHEKIPKTKHRYNTRRQPDIIEEIKEELECTEHIESIKILTNSLTKQPEVFLMVQESSLPKALQTQFVEADKKAGHAEADYDSSPEDVQYGKKILQEDVRLAAATFVNVPIFQKEKELWAQLNQAKQECEDMKKQYYQVDQRNRLLNQMLLTKNRKIRTLQDTVSFLEDKDENSRYLLQLKNSEIFALNNEVVEKESENVFLRELSKTYIFQRPSYMMDNCYMAGTDSDEDPNDLTDSELFNPVRDYRAYFEDVQTRDDIRVEVGSSEPVLDSERRYEYNRMTYEASRLNDHILVTDTQLLHSFYNAENQMMDVNGAGREISAFEDVEEQGRLNESTVINHLRRRHGLQNNNQ